jgi:hypothetical protein
MGTPGDLDPVSAPPLDRDALIARARARPDLPGTLAAMGEVQERLRYDSQAMAEAAAALADALRAVLEDGVPRQTIQPESSP